MLSTARERAVRSPRARSAGPLAHEEEPLAVQRAVASHLDSKSDYVPEKGSVPYPSGSVIRNGSRAASSSSGVNDVFSRATSRTVFPVFAASFAMAAAAS